MTSALPPWYFRRAGVLTLMAFAGVLALPFLWKSPQFSRNSKIVLTVVTVAIAAVLAAVAPVVLGKLEAALTAAGV